MEDHKRFLDRQIALLNAPVDAEVLSTCPADVQAGWKALFAAQTVARKTKLKPAAQLLDQLEILAHEQGSKRRRANRQITKDNAILLDVSSDWLKELPTEWPNRTNAKEAKTYATRVKKVQELQSQRNSLVQQKAHYKKLLTALEGLTAEGLAANLPRPGSELDEQMGQLLGIIEQSRAENVEEADAEGATMQL